MKQTYELNREFKQLLAGNTEAFRNIYLLTINDIYFHVKQIIFNTAEAERMIVKIYKSMYLRLGSLSSPEASVKWMNRIMYSHLNDWINVHCGTQLMDEECGRYDDLGPTKIVTNAHTMLTEPEIANLASQYISHLLPIHALTGLAYFYDNMEMEEMKELLQCDETLIAKRTQYALALIDGYCKDYANEKHVEIKTISVHLLLLAYVLLFKDTVVPNADEIYYAVVQELQ
ncbi:MAG: hypothetical protein IJ291_02805 [Lachnospiraceae bacterium]|nr:hypothetical protein [Lachnospiraceae bacterium]